METLDAALARNGISLPRAAPAAGAYTPVTVVGNLAFVSGQLPRDEGGVRVTGAVGAGTSIEEARDGCQLAVLRALAALRDEFGDFSRIERVLKMNVFVQSGPDFYQQSQVADGASALISELFGPADGRHARSAIGVFKLPQNASVEVELIVALRAD